jgi:hypothetical protein
VINMKKILLCMLVLAAPVFGDIQVTPGTGKTVHTDTVNGLEYQAVKVIDGTTGGTSSMTVTSDGAAKVVAGQSGTYTTTPGSGTTSTNEAQINGQTPLMSQTGEVRTSCDISGTSNTVVLAANQSVNLAQVGGSATATAAAGEAIISCAIQGTSNTVVLAANQSVNVAQVGGGATLMAATGEQKVSVQIAADSNTINLTQINGTTPILSAAGQLRSSVEIAGDSNTVTAVGAAALGGTASGNPLQSGLEVTSTTIPTAQIDGKMIYAAGTNIGQALVTGVPWGIIKTTYSVIISSTQAPSIANFGEAVLVSSAGANTYTYLCGCVFTNTTATAGSVFIESPAGAVADRIPIGLPASNVPSGLFPGCTNPFFRSAANSTTYIYQTVSASAAQLINMYCTYYQGP